MELATNLAVALEKFNKAVRETSVSRLESICQRKAFTIADQIQQRRVKDHWMAQALVSGPDIRVIFSVHFSARSLKKWSTKAFDKKFEDISLLEVQDLSKEYCNLVAGHLKTMLDQNSIRVGMSLPFLSRGFDRVFSIVGPEDSQHNDLWKISAEGVHITCSTNIQIFENFKFEMKASSDDNGDVEFL